MNKEEIEYVDKEYIGSCLSCKNDTDFLYCLRCIKNKESFWEPKESFILKNK